MKKKIAVIIPCYNEHLTIKQVVERYKKALPDADIYVYDNNSSDGSDKLAEEASAIVRYEKNQGKGFVVRSMFRDIDADCYFMVDADDTSTIIKSNNLEVEKGQSITYEQIASDVPTGYNISYMWFQNWNTGRVTYIEAGGSYTIDNDTDLCVGINKNYYTVYVDMHTSESHKGGGTINVEKGGTITYSQIASDVPSGYKIVSMKMQGENSGNEVTMRPGRTYSINEDQTIDLVIEENYYNVYVDIHTSESIVPGGGNIQIEKGKSITYEEVAACVPSGYTIRTMTMQGEDSGETVRMRAGRSYVVNEDQSIDLLVVKN